VRSHPLSEIIDVQTSRASEFATPLGSSVTAVLLVKVLKTP
jgi:hypothetical protein